MKLTVIALVVVICGHAADDPNAARDAKLIATVKAISVQKLDSVLPEVSLEKWLQSQSGPGAQFHWEVNDCGEQTGSPSDNGPVPACVEVDSTLKDGREIVVFIGDDSSPKSKDPDWKMFFAQLVTAREKITLRRLSDLPAALTRTH